MSGVEGGLQDGAVKTCLPVPWCNMIDMYRFVVYDFKLMKALRKEHFGHSSMTRYNLFVNGNLVVPTGKFIKVVDKEGDLECLSAEELAARLTRFDSFLPAVYLRYSHWRSRYVCKMQSSFNGFHFAVYPGDPKKVHSSLLVCHKEGNQEMKAASRVFGSIKKQGLRMGIEVPALNLENPSWFNVSYKFKDVIFDTTG